MTAIYQTSNVTTGREYGIIKQAHRKFNAEFIYQVDIVDFDGEELSLEISAHSASQAARQAEARAASQFIQISYMNVYLVG